MKTCIVCGNPSRNDRSDLCECCFEEALDKKIEDDVWEIKADLPGHGWF